MKISNQLLALLLSTLVLSGCASTCKKSSVQEIQNAPVASSPVVAVKSVAAPVAEPVADQIPVATRKYVSK